MYIRNRIVRVIVAIGAAILISLAVIIVFVRLPIWLMGLVESWEYRSTNDHVTADFIALGAVFYLWLFCPHCQRFFIDSGLLQQLNQSSITNRIRRIQMPNQQIKFTPSGRPTAQSLRSFASAYQQR